MDNIEYLGPSKINGLNLYAYCLNNPIMYSDPSGKFPVLAVILGVTAVVGLGLTMVAIPPLISGGLAAFATTGTLATWIGTGTMVSGVGIGLFDYEEYQEVFNGNNWMLDSGMSEDWYNGLMITLKLNLLKKLIVVI